MASLHAGLSTGRLRIYTPALYDDGSPWHKEREQDRSQLLLKIQSHYQEALDRLTGSDVLRRFLPSGVCVGLLDSVSNIIVNALLTATADMASPPVAVDWTDLGDTERHSLDLGQAELEAVAEPDPETRPDTSPSPQLPVAAAGSSSPSPRPPPPCVAGPSRSGRRRVASSSIQLDRSSA